MEFQDFPSNTFTKNIFYFSVVIYRIDENLIFDHPVVRIEWITPSSKRNGDNRLSYLQKRYFALKAGLSLIEIDLLHETPSDIADLPRYPHQSGSTPYNIIASDPVQSLETGLNKIYSFEVDEPIPIITIPLSDEDFIQVDFGAVYNQVFESLEAYNVRVTYEHLPDRFETYSPADQERIRQVMERAKSNPI